MEMQMGQASRVATIAAQPDGLTCLYAVADPDQRAMLGEVGVSRNRVVGVAYLDPVGFAFSRLAVAKLHANLGNDPRPRRGDCRADRHYEVISILVRAAVAAARAIGLTDVVAGTSRIRKNVGRHAPIGERAARLPLVTPDDYRDYRRQARYRVAVPSSKCHRTGRQPGKRCG